jgi:hypothetical protein
LQFEKFTVPKFTATEPKKAHRIAH